MQKLNTCKYVTIKDLIIFQLSITAVLKVWSEDYWRDPMTFSEGLGGKNYFIIKIIGYLTFHSHLLTVEFSRDCMTYDDVTPLKATEYVLLYFSVLNISILISNQIYIFHKSSSESPQNT